MPTPLSRNRTVAVVGLFPIWYAQRPGHGVAKYMQAYGYCIIPTNSAYAGTYILDEPCRAALADASRALAASGAKIKTVNCRRQGSQIEPIVCEAIALGAACIGM